MLFHLMREGGHDDGSSLAATTVVTKHFHDAVLKRGVLDHIALKSVSACHFREDCRLELLRLVVVLDGLSILVSAIDKHLNLLLKLGWLMVDRHEHDLPFEWVISFSLG